MKNLQLLFELSRHCVRSRIENIADNSYASLLARDKANSIVYAEGFTQRMAGNYVIPSFFLPSGKYHEFGSVYRSAFVAPDSERKRFTIWLRARQALPKLQDYVHYGELLLLEHGIKTALYEYERIFVDLWEEDEYIVGRTSGHHKDILNLLANAANNVPPEKLGSCWVLMDCDYEIQINHLRDRLEFFGYDMAP